MKLGDKEYARYLGGLMANFHSLEFILRAFLQELPTAKPISISSGTNLFSSPVGTELPENEITSYDSLGQLIGKFNSVMESRGLAEIDKTLVDVRDALAHGRVSADSPNDTLLLLKFDKPVNGRVRVVFNEKLTKPWFDAQIKRVHEAILLVVKNVKS